MNNPVECHRCGETHTAVRDEDGYWIANCPQRGTVLVATPEEASP